MKSHCYSICTQKSLEPRTVSEQLRWSLSTATGISHHLETHNALPRSMSEMSTFKTDAKSIVPSMSRLSQDVSIMQICMVQFGHTDKSNWVANKNQCNFITKVGVDSKSPLSLVWGLQCIQSSPNTHYTILNSGTFALLWGGYAKHLFGGRIWTPSRHICLPHYRLSSLTLFMNKSCTLNKTVTTTACSIVGLTHKLMRL